MASFQIVKAEISGEDPRATEGLVSNLPHPRVNKTKQHTVVSRTQNPDRELLKSAIKLGIGTILGSW